MIKGTILLTLIKWNLPVDYLVSYSLFIIQVNKQPLIRFYFKLISNSICCDFI